MVRLLVPGKFHHASLGHQISAQNRQAAGGFNRIGKRVHHFLARQFLRRVRLLIEGFQAGGDLPAMQKAGVQQPLGHQCVAAGVE
jgi:hypothetical protein